MSGTPQLDALDRLLVAELLARYAEAIDAGDFEAVGRLLSDATILDEHGATVASGEQQVRELYESTTLRHADGTPGTAHVITNVVVEPLGADRARVRSRFTVLQATASVPLQPIVVGRYLDEVERRDGEWRFVRRTMVPERWGRIEDHLSFDPRA